MQSEIEKQARLTTLENRRLKVLALQDKARKELDTVKVWQAMSVLMSIMKLQLNS